MQHQPSRSQLLPPPPPPASKPSLNAITTEQIQKYLEDNKNLILAILEYQKLGKFQECAQYQAVLQQNLLYLAAIADAQPPTPQVSNPSQQVVMQMPPNSMPQASSFMQQPAGGDQKLLFQLNSVHSQDRQQQLLNFQQQQQLVNFQQQQQFQAQKGLRAGAQGGLFGMQTALAANPGSMQGGSEAGYGGRSMFRDNGGFGDFMRS